MKLTRILKTNVRALLSHSLAFSREDPFYYADDLYSRDILIRNILRKIDTGVAWLDTIRTPKAASHGERIAEYAFIASILREREPSSILDVGCVLNNPVIADIVTRQSRISFLNPALESVHYQEYSYFKFPLSAWRPGWTFPLVTCLSTIEHIGFDNTRYGINETDLGWDWPRCIEEVVSSIKILYSMTAPGGMMIASCPYGCEEYVLHPPEKGVRTAQVLHMKHVETLRKAFDNKPEIITLRLSANGWENHAPDGLFQPYGTIGPGASGLLLVSWQKGIN